MRDRRKRLKSAVAPSCLIDPRSRLCIESHLDSSEILREGVGQNRVTCTVDSLSSEGGSFVSRCSIRLIHEVVSKFDSWKKDLVKSIGFEGILHFPAIKKFNRKFSLWLMRCVDERSATINIGQDIRISFNKYDVAHVFGIPFSGKTVSDPIVASREAKDRVIQDFLGKEFNEQRSIKTVQEILERNYGQSVNKEDADRFKVAFVVFVVSNLLAPSAKHDYAVVDYWNAIQDPDAISSYDWAEFVISRLLEAVAKLKQDIANNIKFPNIAGCSIFLQVLYLDSLELEGLSMPHDSFPRVRAFSFEMIRTMILADKNFGCHTNQLGESSTVKLCEAVGCIYSWALQICQQQSASRSGCLLAIWESVVAMVNFLDIPFEAAGPLFVATVDFQEEINSSCSVCGTIAIKFMSVLVSLLTPYRRGFRYETSHVRSSAKNGTELLEADINNGTRLLSVPIRLKCKKECNILASPRINGRSEVRNYGGCSSCSMAGESASSNMTLMLNQTAIGDDVQRRMNDSFSRCDNMPDYLNVNLCVAMTMNKFYSVTREAKPVNDFDLNAAASGEICVASSSSSSAVGDVVSVPSPWELGYCWCLRDINAKLVIDKLRSIQDDDRLAIVHREPKYIQVSIWALRAQLTAKREMEVDLFDALVRIARQQDDLLYSSYGSVRWRYFFESDFMANIISGVLNPLDDNTIHERLSLSYSSYDLANCKLVFFPSLLQCQWVCFVWQPQKNRISVFDPSYGLRVPETRVQLIERVCYFLKLVLKTLTLSVFVGVPHDVASADLCIMNLAGKDMPRINRSGLLCSGFYRCFDGSELTPNFPKVGVDAIAAKICQDIGMLKDNLGEFSLFYAESA